MISEEFLFFLFFLASSFISTGFESNYPDTLLSVISEQFFLRQEQEFFMPV